jgi:flagellar biogenesis protein FliO
MTTLKQVQISGTSQIDLLFDGKIQKNQIRTEFFNDVIQISLSESSVYPAKISSVNGGKLVKIFAYQYAPKLVRCRLTVKGRAEDYKDRVELIPNGRLLTVRLSETALAPVGDRAAEEARAQPNKKHIVAASAPADSAASASSRSTAEEASLLDHVMKSSGTAKASSPAVATTSADETAGNPQPLTTRSANLSGLAGQSGPSVKNSNVHLTGGAPLPSPWKIMGKLLFVVALFCAGAFAFKKFAKGEFTQPAHAKGVEASLSFKSFGKSFGKSIGGTLEELARSAGASIGGKHKMVEVISNHYIGPKKTISIVRVGSRILVLGVANESVNLITELEEEELPGFDKITAAIEPAAVKPSKTTTRQPQFESQLSELLRSETVRAPAASGITHPTATDPVFAVLQSQVQASVTTGATSGGAVRSQIRNRLEGLKQL